MSRPSRRSTTAMPRERPAPQATASVFTARCRRLPTSTVSRSNTAVSSRIRTWITRAAYASSRSRPPSRSSAMPTVWVRISPSTACAIRSSACSASAPRSSTAAAAFPESIFPLPHSRGSTPRTAAPFPNFTSPRRRARKWPTPRQPSKNSSMTFSATATASTSIP